MSHKDIAYSRFKGAPVLDRSLTSVCEGEWTERIYAQYLDSVKNENKRARTNLYVLINNFAQNGLVRISGNKNHYDRSFLSYKLIVKDFIPILLKEGVIEQVGGYYHPRESRRKGTMTRYQATTKFNETLKNEVNNGDFETIFTLRDEEGRDKFYKRLPGPYSWRVNVLKENMKIMSRIKIETSERRILKLTAKCVFNEVFERGGRIFYNCIQNYKKEERETLLFNEEETAEEDYQSMHINLLYRQAGLKPLGDAYKLKSEEMIILTAEQRDERRKLIKLVMLVMLNASSDHACVGAVYSKTRDKAINDFLESEDGIKWRKVHRKNYGQALNEEIFKRGFNKDQVRKDIVNIMTQLKVSHAPIAAHFNSCAAHELMNLESSIAFAIIKEFNKLNKPIISIHDSFIVRAQDREILKETMKKMLQSLTSSEISQAA